jgi:hypothetical protein
MYFLTYILGVVGFCIWDSVFGWWGVVEFDGKKNPPAFIPGFAWFVVVPMILMLRVVMTFEAIKDARIAKAQEEMKVRVKTEADLQEAMKLVDEEFDSTENKFEKQV